MQTIQEVSKPVVMSVLSFNEERALRRALIGAWRQNPKQGPCAHAAYALIRGKSLNKTFSPLKSATKIACQAKGNPNMARDAAAFATLHDYNGLAWGWADVVFSEAGLSRTKFKKQWDLRSHPVVSAWIDAALLDSCWNAGDRA
jgi:hypothetical protein